MGEDAPYAHTPSCRVLVLDFDERTLIALQQVLEEAGFNATTTWDVGEAFVYLERQRFDAILVGDHPPEIDAYAIVRRLQNAPRHVPCIVMHAARQLTDAPKLNGLVATIPGCATAEILGQLQQHFRRAALQTTPPSTL